MDSRRENLSGLISTHGLWLLFSLLVCLLNLCCISHSEANCQELVRLPQIESGQIDEAHLDKLQARVQQLETALERLQRSSSSTEWETEPVNEACCQVNAEPDSVLLASFAESLSPKNYSVDLGGYVKADLIHDLDAIGSTDVFDPLTIPTDGRPGENTRLHARQTRLNLDVRPNNGEEMQLFVETDFFGTTDPFRRSRAFLRLRHAYVRAGRFLAGQTWTTFMDETILPSTLDFESPRSVILDRRAVVRWTQPVNDSLDLAFALEDPRPVFDLNSAPSGDLERPAPDLIGRARFETSWGHLQSAALVRMLRYRQDNGIEDDEIGWGFNFTGRANLHDFDSVLFQVAFGEAIESYRQAPDAAVGANGLIEVIPLVAWVVGYEVNWTERITSTLVYSAGDGTNTAFQLPGAPQAAEYLAANLIFYPRPGFSWGAEYLYGARTDADNSMGQANRIQFSVRLDIP